MFSRDLFNAIVYVVVVAAPLTLPAAAVLIYLRTRPEERPALRRLAVFAAGFGILDLLLLWALPWLGLSFGPIRLSLMLLLVGRGVALLAVWVGYRPVRRGLPALLLINALISAGVAYAFYFEPFDLRVSDIRLEAEEIAAGKRLRVVQLSDIHIERLTKRERAVVERVRELHPDVIVLTGDYLNLSYLRDERAVADLRWMLSQLSAPLGVYAVSGSVERPGRMREELMAGLEIRVLDNETKRLDWAGGEVELVGVSDFEFEDNVENVHRLAASVPPERFTVLLYHTPDMIEEAQKSGIDLILAGHTHGGQIRLPVYGALITFSAFGKQYEQGLYRMGKTQMYVSRGLGMEGGLAPRARFLAPPEIVVVDLVGIQPGR